MKVSSFKFQAPISFHLAISIRPFLVQSEVKTVNGKMIKTSPGDSV